MPARATQSASVETPLGPKLPLRLGRYSLCEELGAGGMATVYLARMELAAGLDRLVALKTIHPHLAREKPFVDMFLDEARIASHVSHPNVCATYDFGEVEGVYYLAMEHLLGEPLFDVINRLVERFDDVREVLPYVAARVVADACEGLHAAHGARGPDGAPLGIVHRDVSPQNLFITYDGAVKVVDFGCAKAAQRVAHTSTGVMKGKVGYAAPEQLRAEEMDQRADVWALGVCLWEALTLSPLFTKDTAMKTAMSVLEDPVALASDGRGWVPERVAQIADKALQRDPAARYASAREMGRDLRKFIADSGFTLEAAELAEWMEFLFEERRSEREAQVARVREMSLEGIAAAHVISGEMAAETVSADDVQLLPDASSGLEPVPVPDSKSAESVASEPSARREGRPDSKRFTPAKEEPKAGGSRWLLALVVLLGLGVGGYVLNQYYEPAPWLLELVGAEPRTGPDATTPRVSAPPGEGSTERAARGSAPGDTPAGGTAANAANPARGETPSGVNETGNAGRVNAANTGAGSAVSNGVNANGAGANSGNGNRAGAENAGADNAGTSTGNGTAANGTAASGTAANGTAANGTAAADGTAPSTAPGTAPSTGTATEAPAPRRRREPTGGGVVTTVM